MKRKGMISLAAALVLAVSVLNMGISFAAEESKGKICLDPGHQGSWVDMSAQEENAPGSGVMKTKATTGTSSNFGGKAEYEVNLGVSLLVKDVLSRRGYDVVMTREDNDKAISNKERATLATETGCDVIVRIHCNSDAGSSANGALAMVPSPGNPYVGELSTESYKLGECVLNRFCEATKLANDGIIYADDMTGMNWSTVPVMILEMGFMSNESDDAYLQEESHWDLMADAIADGIDSYFS